MFAPGFSVLWRRARTRGRVIPCAAQAVQRAPYGGVQVFPSYAVVVKGVTPDGAVSAIHAAHGGRTAAACVWARCLLQTNAQADGCPV